jgi:hypothetical protein
MATTIRRRIPPQRLITAVNPLVRFVMRSPLHRLTDDSTLILHVTGRKSGRQYDIPVGFTDLGGRLEVITQHSWRQNLRGGADVSITRFGRRTPMHADLDEDPATVATILQAIIDRLGPAAALQRVGLATDAESLPDAAALTQAAAELDLAAISIRPT